MRSDVVLVDLDGTLCDNSHRQHMIDRSLIGTVYADAADMWRTYSQACYDDALVTSVLTLLELLWDDRDIYLITGRSDAALAQTETWLLEHSVVYDRLLMREEGDTRNNAELKRAWLKEIQEEGAFISLVIDDNPSVRGMCEEEGVPCLLVANGINGHWT